MSIREISCRNHLRDEIEKSARWTATYAKQLAFQVTHVMYIDSFMVDLADQTYSYSFCDFIGIPCRHVVSAIHRKVDDPINYVHKSYHKTTYVRCMKKASFL